MKTWVPWEEVREELMKKPGFAEGVRLAGLELDAELAAERAAITHHHLVFTGEKSVAKVRRRKKHPRASRCEVELCL